MDGLTYEAAPADAVEAALSVDAGTVAGAVVRPTHTLIDVHVTLRPLIPAPHIYPSHDLHVLCLAYKLGAMQHRLAPQHVSKCEYGIREQSILMRPKTKVGWLSLINYDLLLDIAEWPYRRDCQHTQSLGGLSHWWRCSL